MPGSHTRNDGAAAWRSPSTGGHPTPGGSGATAPTVMDATALLIPFACYWELAPRALLRAARGGFADRVPSGERNSLSASTDAVDEDTDANAGCRRPGAAPPVEPRTPALPAGWAIPLLPPMVMQMLVGRFVRHIGWVPSAGPPSAGATPQSAHGSRSSGGGGSTTAPPVDLAPALGPPRAAVEPLPPLAGAGDGDPELAMLMVRGRSTSYWEGDSDGSSTRGGTPQDDEQYVRDEEANVVVRQGSAGLLSGGQPPPFTGRMEALAGDEHALAAAAPGTVPARFRFPTGLTCLPHGHLAVCSDETRLTIINQHGMVVRSISAIGGLRFPRGLTALGGTLLAIADGGHHRVLVADYARGVVIREIGTRGVPGDGPEDFNCPSGMARVLGHGDVLAICDQMNHRVKLVNWRTARCLAVLGAGRRGRGSDEFNSPWGIDCLPLEHCFADPADAQRARVASAASVVQPPMALAVCDQDNHRLKLMTTSGLFIRHIGGSPHGGAGRDDFSRPRGVVALDGGLLCVSDICNHRIKVVDARTGAFLREFTSITTSCMTGILRGPAAAAAETLYPLGLTALPGGDIAVGDRDNHRVTVLRP